MPFQIWIDFLGLLQSKDMPIGRNDRYLITLVATSKDTIERSEITIEYQW
jgi:hypothetical protein